MKLNPIRKDTADLINSTTAEDTSPESEPAHRYTIRATFRDKNQPAIIDHADTAEQAGMFTRQILRTYAAIKAVYIKDHIKKETTVINSAGYTLFTIGEL